MVRAGSNHGHWLGVAALIAATSAILLVGVWLLRGGAGTASSADIVTVSDSLLPGPELAPPPAGDAPLPVDPEARSPIIGAFQSRVQRTLAARALRTQSLAGALTLRVRDVVWQEADGSVFATSPSLTGRLDLARLRTADIVLSEVVVTRPTVHLRQTADAWNYEAVLARLLAEDEQAARRETRRVAVLSGVTINSGTVTVNMPERRFTLEELDAQLRRVDFSGPTVSDPVIVATSASAILVQPVEGRRLALRAEDAQARILDEEVAFEVERFTLEGARLADVRGVWRPTLPVYGVEAQGRALEVRLAHLRQFLPDTVVAQGVAAFAWSIEPASATAVDVTLRELTFEGEGSRLTGELTLRVDAERAQVWDADLRLDPLTLALVKSFTRPLPYEGALTGTVRGSAGQLHFDVAAALRAQGVEEPFITNLSGQVAIAPDGFVIQEILADLDDVPLAALRPIAPWLALAGTVNGQVGLRGPPARAPLAVDVRLELASGSASVQGTIDLTGNAPVYDLNGTLLGIDLQRLLLPAAPPVRLGGRFWLEGRGIDPAEAEASVRLLGHWTGWESEPGDTIIVVAQIRAGTVHVDTLTTRLATFSAQASGEWRFVEPQSGSVRYAASYASLAPWSPYLPVMGDKVAAGSLALTGTVGGSLQRPRLEGELHGEDVSFGGWTARNLEARYTGHLARESPEGQAQLTLRGFETPTAGSYRILTASTSFTRPDFTLALNGVDSSGGVLEIAAIGRIPVSGPRELTLERAGANLLGRRWTLLLPATFSWGGLDGFVAENFALHEESGEGLIRVHGTLLPLREADFQLETAALPLGELQQLFGFRPVATGELWTVTRVEGPGAAPVVDMDFRLENGTFEGVTLTHVEGTVDYSLGNLRATATAALDTAGAFELEASIPLILDLGGAQMFTLTDNGAISGSLTAQAVSLTPLASMTPQLQRVRGRLDGRVSLSGTFNDPVFGGRVVLTDGAVTIPLLGQEYREIGGQIALEGRRLAVPEVRARSGGTMLISGAVTFEDLKSPVADLAMRLDQFRAIGVPDQPDAAFHGQLSIAGPWDALAVTGRLSISDGYIPIPQLETNLDDLYSELPAIGGPGPQPSAVNRLMEGLAMRELVVDIGNGVWFTAPAARAQLAGRLTVDGSADALRIQGTLEGERGIYTLQAGPIVRRFEIRRAQVRFLGSPEPNPAIDITARRTAFDERGNPIDVEVHIGGSLRTPTLRLASADLPAFPQAELLSVLFFGTSSLELGGAGIPGEAILEASLADLASLELEEAIIRDLGLGVDIFQVRFGPGRSGFGTPTFVFGWELGRDFFLTAESGIASLFASEETRVSTWALRLEWAFDRRSRARIGYEPVTSSRVRRGLDLGLPANQQKQQVSLEVRRRWSY